MASSLLRRGQIRDMLMERLKTHAELSSADLELYRNILIASDYFSLPDHRGGSVGPTEKYYRRDGTQHTLEDVPLPKIVKGLESHIKRVVPADKRTEVYHKVLGGVPGHKDTPEWDIPPESPNEKPVTPFSKPSHVKSNKELLDALASAADLKPTTVSSIEIQVTWWDGCAGMNGGCMMSFNDGVSGGRLGRDHKFEDVPSNYVRDMLMDYITTQLPEEKHKAAHKAICCDLTDEQIVEYLDLLAQAKEKRERPQKKAKERPQRVADERVQSLSDEKLAKAQDLVDDKQARTLNEALNMVMLEEAFDSIDADIYLIPLRLGLTSNVSMPKLELGITRNASMPKLLSRSVVKPGRMPTDEEREIILQSEVDWNCDQIRAMIKIFVSEGEWTLDEFRQALGSVSRQQLTSFLSKTGHEGPQQRTSAYLLSWDFFNWREYLGLPLSGARISKDLAAVEKLRRKRVRDQERADRERVRRQARAEKEKSPTQLRGKRQKKDARPALDELFNEAKRACVAQPNKSKPKPKT